MSLKNSLTKNDNYGDAGYRSPYLSHAKRALYHLRQRGTIEWFSFWVATGKIVARSRRNVTRCRR
ncbi:hypothetical protein MTR_2g087420 [Medicago truncatula]|uniref:Uncharacterized protein n=1 Tax=Medicago truncatula TaxID=3880 RepID=G7IRE6_MEDTR|nr:hypothetical protein MTR_2g087420 [Medicago truncatula]